MQDLPAFLKKICGEGALNVRCTVKQTPQDFEELLEFVKQHCPQMDMSPVAGDLGARVLNMGRGLRSLRLERGYMKAAVNHVAFAPEGRLVVTASDDGSAAVWDPATGQRIRTLKHDDGVNWAAFDAGGTKIVTASEDGTARLWEAGSGAPIGTPMRHGAPVAMAAFSPRGDLVITAASDGTARDFTFV